MLQVETAAGRPANGFAQVAQKIMAGEQSVPGIKAISFARVAMSKPRRPNLQEKHWPVWSE
jgi:hypothetical protein